MGFSLPSSQNDLIPASPSLGSASQNTLTSISLDRAPQNKTQDRDPCVSDLLWIYFQKKGSKENRKGQGESAKQECDLTDTLEHKWQSGPTSVWSHKILQSTNDMTKLVSPWGKGADLVFWASRSLAELTLVGGGKRCSLPSEVLIFASGQFSVVFSPIIIAHGWGYTRQRTGSGWIPAAPTLTL